MFETQGSLIVGGNSFDLLFDVLVLENPDDNQVIWQGDFSVDFPSDDGATLAEVLRLEEATRQRPICTLRLKDGREGQIRCAHLSTDEEIDGCFTATWNFSSA